ncbi:glycosyltransferase family 4 protein [Hymenobacter profundi]|uniref:Glycosyltransferase family 4 protein n=1 Tax=Hymenobacter profundi TaxID=1982110 RepID=A0ABS6WVE6_9BACT|nr:glycosyltransferase family 4 protein [Hymenobacter profundi]MBW3127590.1 glycosyltransferase family 4 protein [Hymenobacter profundi]
MKVVFVSLLRVLPWGGSEELWFRTAKLAIAQGHTVYTLTQHWDTTPGRIAELQKLGATALFYQKPQYSLLDRVAIKAKVKQSVAEVVPPVEADVLVISNGTTFDFAYQPDIMAVLLKSAKPYILISQHSFENGNVISASIRERNLHIMRQAAKFFFVSKRNLHSIQRQIACYLDNTQIISNPLNIKDIAIKPFPATQKLLMACVARLDCGFKGQDILLEVLSGEQWRNRDFHLSFYGTGPDQEHLRHLIQLYDLQEKVKIEGHVSDIDQIWQANHVLVLPSLSEGTPLALVEAMLSGRAAVTTDVGDNSEYVLHGITGFLADCASRKCITAVLEELWLKKDHLQVMGERAFEHASKITDLHPDETLLSFIETVK